MKFANAVQHPGSPPHYRLKRRLVPHLSGFDFQQLLFQQLSSFSFFLISFDLSLFVRLPDLLVDIHEGNITLFMCGPLQSGLMF
jgi:hypothetical protein